MNASRIAMNRVPPAATTTNMERRTTTTIGNESFSNNNSNYITPPLLQHHKIVSKGKLKGVYLILILVVVLFLCTGLTLNHHYHLRSLSSSASDGKNSDSNTNINSKNDNTIDTSSDDRDVTSIINNNKPPRTMHPQDEKHVVRNVDVDDDLVHPIPTHFKPHRVEIELKQKRQRKNKKNTNVKKATSSEAPFQKKSNVRPFPFYFPKNRPPQDTIGDAECEIATLLDKNLREHRKESLLKQKQKIVDEQARKNENNNDEENNNNNAAQNGDDAKTDQEQEARLMEIDYQLAALSQAASTSNIIATRCLRLAIFTTLKPCTSEENIWTQFAAISSWLSAPLHPPPTVVIYDTGLKTELNDLNSNNKNNNNNIKSSKKKNIQNNNVDEINSVGNDENLFADPDRIKVFHSNFEESEVVKDFAKTYGITNLNEDDDNDETEDEQQQQMMRSIPPSVTNYSNAASNPDKDIIYEYNTPPESVRSGSCGWLLTKMIEKFFDKPTKVQMKAKKNGEITTTDHYLFPRVAVVAPTPRLVGPTHETLLLGRAIHHLTKTVMPALRPLDVGVFDVTAFINSDIIFDSEKLATVLANGIRSLRKFMFVGRRQSLNIDKMKETLADAFKTQLKLNKKRRKREEQDANINNNNNNFGAREVQDQQQQQGSSSNDDRKLENANGNKKELSLWHGVSFFEKFFPSSPSSSKGKNNHIIIADNDDKYSLLKILNRQPEHSSDRIDAEDYFFWTRGFLNRPFFPFSIPPFHIGRPAFDNWLVSNSIHSNQPVVDITYTRLTAIHVENSLRKNKMLHQHRDKMSNKDRAYWRGDDHDTKENYRLGEQHGGWQHGLLEFVPLKMQMVSDMTMDANAKSLFDHDHNGDDEKKKVNDNNNNVVVGGQDVDDEMKQHDKKRKKSSFTKNSIRHHQQNNKIDDEDVDDTDLIKNENDERKFFHRNMNDVRIGMKRKWKGLEGVGVDLESPKNYWKKMQQFFSS